MSELLNAGNCCFLCSQIDFLPTLCPFCRNQFCKNHIQHEAHSCSAANRTDPVESFTKLQRCTLDGCKNPSLNASRSSNIPTCKACQGSFCVEHREPGSHSCSPKQGAPEPTRNETARALLAKNFTSNPSSKLPVKRRIPAKPIDPAKLAQFRKLELMKLRQLASPLDSKLQKTTIPADQRRFFRASMDSKPTRDLWVEKNVKTGKAFDLLAAQFGIPNAETDKYQLSQVSGEAEQLGALLYDQPLADQVEDGGELVLSIKG